MEAASAVYEEARAMSTADEKAPQTRRQRARSAVDEEAEATSFANKKAKARRVGVTCV